MSRICHLEKAHASQHLVCGEKDANREKILSEKLFAVIFFFFFFEGQTNTLSFISINKVLIQRGCLVCVFKQPFSVFKQYFTYFYTFFHPHVFPQMFSNNNFQFLNICTKRTQSIHNGRWRVFQPIHIIKSILNMFSQDMCSRPAQTFRRPKAKSSNESWSCNNLQPYLASIARLKLLKSRNPIPPSFLGIDKKTPALPRNLPLVSNLSLPRFCTQSIELFA